MRKLGTGDGTGGVGPVDWGREGKESKGVAEVGAKHKAGLGGWLDGHCWSKSGREDKGGVGRKSGCRGGQQGLASKAGGG